MTLSKTAAAAWLALALTTTQLTAQTALAPADEPPSSDPAPSDPGTSEEEALRQQIRALDQRLRILERKREIEGEQAAERAKTASTTLAGKEGFQIKSADGAFALKLRGYLQADGRFYAGDDGRRSTDTFLLRRVRPILEGTLYGRFDFRIMPDFGGGTAVLQDAYVDARLAPWLRIRAGKFKPPVGLERLTSGTDLLFVERGQPTSLVPNRDVGVQVHGELAAGAIAYQVGIFNGVPDGGSSDADADDGKDVATRVFVQPFLHRPASAFASLGFGLAASTGHPRGSVSAPGLPTYKSTGQLTFFSYRADGTAIGTVVADGRRHRLAPQLSWYTGPFGLLAEWVRSSSTVTRSATVRTLDATAAQVATSWVLGGSASARGAMARAPFDPAARTFGALELKARWNRLEVDGAAFPIFADIAKSARRATSFGLGCNWILNRNLRLLVDYERTRFDGGAAQGDRPDERVLLSRVQVAF